MSSSDRIKTKEQAGWKCQLCDRLCRQSGEDKGGFIQRVGDVYFNSQGGEIGQFTLVTVQKDSGDYIAVCSPCAMPLIQRTSRLSPTKQQRKLEVISGQLRLDV